MPDGPTKGSGGRAPDTGPEGEPAPHGAAAPLTVGGRPPSRRFGSRGDGRGAAAIVNRYRRIPLTGYQWLLIILLALYLVAISPLPIFGGKGGSAGFRKTPKNMIGISYGGGPIESAHFQRIVQPGSKLFFNGLFDSLYLYPADEQNYIVSLNPRQGAVRGKDSIIAPTSDRVALTYQVAIYFKLNTDLLRQFHEQLGLQYAAYTSSGWNNLLQDTFRQNIENAVQEQTRRFSVSELYGNSQNLIQFQRTVQDDFGARLVSALGAPYFCSPNFEPKKPCGEPTFIVKQIDIPQVVGNAFVNERAAQIQVAQRASESAGIKDLQSSGINLDGQSYALIKAIESGAVTFWVVPQGTGLNLPGGGTSGGSAPSTPSIAATTSPTTAPKTTTTGATPTSP
jgi:hypothetical protein